MRIIRTTSILLVLAAVVALSPASYGTPSSRAELTNRLLNGNRIVNVIDDFLPFWDQAKGKKLGQQRRLWYRMVESKHSDYFERAVYRGATRGARRAMLDRFLRRVPERVEAIRRLNKWLPDAILLGVSNFRYRFPDYVQGKDVYLGLSLFKFDGSIRSVQNEQGLPDTLCLGLEVLAGYSVEQLQIVIAHELFHLYHFGFLVREPFLTQLGTPHIPLAVEGMAVAAVEELYPFLPATLYLHFSEDELSWQRDLLAWNSQRYLELVRAGAGYEEFEPWFTNGGAEGVPARGGYLIGYELAKRVLAAYSLDEMVRMNPAELREHVEEQLAAMSQDQILLMADAD